MVTESVNNALSLGVKILTEMQDTLDVVLWATLTSVVVSFVTFVAVMVRK